MEQQITFTNFQEFIEEFRRKYPIGQTPEEKENNMFSNTRTIPRVWMKLRFEIENKRVQEIQENLQEVVKTILCVIEEVITTPEAKTNLFNDLEQILFFPQYSIVSPIEEHLQFVREYLSLDAILEEGLQNNMKYPPGYRTSIRNICPRLFQSIVRISLKYDISPKIILQDILSKV